MEILETGYLYSIQSYNQDTIKAHKTQLSPVPGLNWRSSASFMNLCDLPWSELWAPVTSSDIK